MSLLLAFDDETTLARRLADAAGLPLAIIERHRFPDGESRLRLPPSLPARTVLLRGLQQPNDKLAELMLAAAGARELGARRLTLVSPYLAYMRQDIAFVPGEVVSQRHLGRALAAWFDDVVTVDPHLHRVSTMDEVVPGRRGIALTAAPLLGAWVGQQQPDALLLGPDEESMQWVQVAAAVHGLDHAVCHKLRHADRAVSVTLPEIDLHGRAVVLLDDVASTGRTLVEAARGALIRGAITVDVAVTHALLVGEAMQELREAGVRHVWSTDSVPHPSNVVSIGPMLARALSDIAA
ncbi:MAG: ribose-phosphate diphosphokinase [Burkholderiaceae bacterium]|nr:ribose-phosphate diphosphokinase [Burkholderiaceae bacterium]